jgi:hypothetical protein
MIMAVVLPIVCIKLTFDSNDLAIQRLESRHLET